MNFSGFVKTSLIDYPGKVAAIVFTQGCNFRCGFCHNPDLIPLRLEEPIRQYSEGEILDYLRKRASVLDGIVITGGEPLINPEIHSFIKKVKSLNMKVKLDTNGSNPILLERLISENLVDYVAMDIKGTLSDYQKICGFNDSEGIKKSINILLKDNVDYEFRTTVLPYYHDIESFKELGKAIRGAKKYTIQGFRSQVTLDGDILGAKAFTISELQQIGAVMKAYVKEIIIHDNL